MNDKQRKEFQNKLEETIIPCTIPENEIRPLWKGLFDYLYNNHPHKLFRYRPINENNIDAFDRDIFFAVKPKCFNDPYDSLYWYDENEIQEIFRKMSSKEFGKKIIIDIKNKGDLPKCVKQLLDKQIIDEWIKKISQIDDIDLYVREQQRNVKQYFGEKKQQLKVLNESLKNSVNIACFSEKIQSILMWSHYADNHKGFALEYDTKKLNKYDYNNDAIMDFCGLFPVIYDRKRFDATDYAFYSLANGNYFSKQGIGSYDIMDHIKIYLYKANEWKYEKEWRLIYFDIKGNSPIKEISQKPVAIYYGSNISSINKKILHSFAEKKGIKEYEMHVTNRVDRSYKILPY